MICPNCKGPVPVSRSSEMDVATQSQFRVLQQLAWSSGYATAIESPLREWYNAGYQFYSIVVIRVTASHTLDGWRSEL